MTKTEQTLKLRNLAKAAAGQVAEFPQYANHFDGRRLARVKRNVATKMGTEFVKGEIVLAVDRAMFPESLDSDAGEWTVTAWSMLNAIDTSLKGSDVEWL